MGATVAELRRENAELSEYIATEMQKNMELQQKLLQTHRDRDATIAREHKRTQELSNQLQALDDEYKTLHAECLSMAKAASFQPAPMKSGSRGRQGTMPQRKPTDTSRSSQANDTSSSDGNSARSRRSSTIRDKLSSKLVSIKRRTSKAIPPASVAPSAHTPLSEEDESPENRTSTPSEPPQTPPGRASDEQFDHIGYDTENSEHDQLDSDFEHTHDEPLSPPAFEDSAEDSDRSSASSIAAYEEREGSKTWIEM